MKITEKVYQILIKKRYNRNEPYSVNEIKQRIAYSISNNKPIKLVGFWGIGSKKRPTGAESATCEFLNELNNEIKQIYPSGIDFLFIFANIHGIHNGIDDQTIISYTNEMKKLFQKFGFTFIHLDKLWNKYGITFDKINKILKSKPNDWWTTIHNSKILEKNAKKISKNPNHVASAKKYYIMRNLEKKMLEEEFKDSIFHTFSGLKNINPNMPTLYLYSRKGWSNSPWFVN
jgi:pyoverdine/dityrosine biosynthesis protein Dit1